MNEPVTQLVVNDRRTERDAPARVNTLPSNPLEMLAVAQARGASIEELKQFMDLQERWEKNEARKAYVEAMAAFKSEPVEILKTKFVNVPGGAKFHHATLADVVDAVIAPMSKHGLSHNWIVETGELIKVTCVVTHKLGHSERCDMSGPPDAGPGRNKIQAVGSTTTYFQRYTLMSLLGLAAKDMDDDGRGGSAPKERPKEPEGYATWSMDMEALADEGKAKLLPAWKSSKQEFRDYATQHDGDWWARCKNKANRVQG